MTLREQVLDTLLASTYASNGFYCILTTGRTGFKVFQDITVLGKESVGVSRRYCGNMGKVENCQCGVFVDYGSERGYGLVDRRWFVLGILLKLPV